MKKYLLLTLTGLAATALTLPMLTGLLDLVWWFWTNHTLTSLDWSAERSYRVALAWGMMIPATFAWLAFSFCLE